MLNIRVFKNSISEENLVIGSQSPSAPRVGEYIFLNKETLKIEAVRWFLAEPSFNVPPTVAFVVS